jgi:hypothetical protein
LGDCVPNRTKQRQRDSGYAQLMRFHGLLPRVSPME